MEGVAARIVTAARERYCVVSDVLRTNIDSVAVIVKLGYGYSHDRDRIRVRGTRLDNLLRVESNAFCVVNYKLTLCYYRYFLVPLTIAIGRRPVLLATGAMTWCGGFWAGYSHSLNSHLAARAFQGLGAGAVEALVSIQR